MKESDAREQKGILTRALVLACTAICLLGCKPSPVPEGNPAPVTKHSGDAELANLIESTRVREGLTALASAIIINGNILSVAAVGTREYGTDNWVTVNDKFLISSCTKAFTATLAAMLVEEDLIDWQTTIRDAFPGLEMLSEYENITIYQLLSHRAGLPKNFKSGQPTWDINYGFDQRRGTTPEVYRLQYLEKTVQKKLICPPGERVHYSNSGYILAGAIIEKMAGRTIDELWAEKIFKPLGISTAGYGPPAALDPKNQPWGHYWNKSISSFVVYKADYPNFMGPAGYMHISVKDWAKFILMHLDSYPFNKKRLLKLSTLQMLHKPPDSVKWDIDINLGFNYSLGWFTKKAEDDHSLIWHGGRGFDYNAQVVADLDAKTAILIVSTAEVPHMHPQTHLLKIVKKIKKYYSGKIDLPSIL
jgi:CubicO group peptidase (beta-lactamase class C family)